MRAGRDDESAFLTETPTMTMLTLTFNGPPSQARRALGGLLQRFHSAYFVERSSLEYMVTADDITAAELAKQPLWSTRLGQEQARR
jgi:hypothetical protein